MIHKLLLGIFIAFCVLTAGIAFGYSLHKPFTLDESDIANRAHAINLYGPDGPVIVMGGDKGEAMPHPPLYEYLMAGIFKVFGETEAAARGFGIFCFLLVGLFMALTIEELLKGQSRFLKNAALLYGLSIFCLNPLLIQHTMLIDADTTCIAVLTAAFVYFFVRYDKADSKEFFKSRFLLALIFAFSYLSKEITPTFISVGIVGYRLLNREWKKLLLDLVFVIFLGLAMAWGIWGTYCLLTKTDMMIFLKQQYVWRVTRLDNMRLYKSVMKNIVPIARWPLFWMTAPFFVVAIYCLGARLLNFLKKFKLESVDYLLLASTVIWIPYLLVKPSVDMMKYQHPTYPLYIAAISFCFAKALAPHEAEIKAHWPKMNFLFSAALIFMGFMTLHYYKIGDYIYYLFEPLHSFKWKEIYPAYFKPMILLTGPVIIWALLKRKYLRLSFFVIAFLFIIPISAALNFRQTAKYTTAESWLNYGESGFRETTDYLATQLKPGSQASLRKDMVYYMRFRYNIPDYSNYAIQDLFMMEGVENIDRLMRRTRVEYVVIDRTFLLHPPKTGELKNYFMRYYQKDKTFGGFTLFKLRESF